MILKKTIVDEKEIYQPISFDEALKQGNKDGLIFTDEDEREAFEEAMEEETADGENDERAFANEGAASSHKRFFKRGNITAMLPFLDDDELHDIVCDMIEHKDGYSNLNILVAMPFLSDSDCDELFMAYVVKGEYEKQSDIVAMAPFVSEKCLGALVDEYVEGKYQTLDMSALYPFMASKDIKKLFDYFLKQRHKPTD